MAVIYQIKNTVSGKRYIGSTVNSYNRFKLHQSLLRRNCHHSPILQAAWNKHGEGTFFFQVLAVVEDTARLTYEQLLLDHYKPEYNIATDASSPSKGRSWGSHSEETRAVLSEKAKLQRHSRESYARQRQKLLGRTTAGNLRSSKRVERIDASTGEVTEFPSILAATKVYPSRRAIQLCLAGEMESYRGGYWKLVA